MRFDSASSRSGERDLASTYKVLSPTIPAHQKSVWNSSASELTFRTTLWNSSRSQHLIQVTQNSTFLSRSIVCKVLQTRPVLPNENFLIEKGIRRQPQPGASGSCHQEKIPDNCSVQEGDRHLIAILLQDKRSPPVQSRNIELLARRITWIQRYLETRTLFFSSWQEHQAFQRIIFGFMISPWKRLCVRYYRK